MGKLNYDAVAKREFVAYPLDETLYTLGEEEIAFFKSQTGIDDEQELKRHILRVQKEAYEVPLRYRGLIQLRSDAFGLTSRCSRTRASGGSHLQGETSSGLYICCSTSLTPTPPSLAGSRSPTTGSTRTSCAWAGRGLERSSSKWLLVASDFSAFFLPVQSRS